MYSDFSKYIYVPSVVQQKTQDVIVYFEHNWETVLHTSRNRILKKNIPVYCGSLWRMEGGDNAAQYIHPGHKFYSTHTSE